MNLVLQRSIVKKTVLVSLTSPLVHGLLQFQDCGPYVPEPFCQPPEHVFIESVDTRVGPKLESLARSCHIQPVREGWVCLYVVGS